MRLKKIEQNFKGTKPRKIILFISNESVYFAAGLDEFKKIVVTLAQIPLLETKVIDITSNPELAEKYCITALPTLIVDNKKYIGKPAAKKAIELFESFAA